MSATEASAKPTRPARSAGTAAKAAGPKKAAAPVAKTVGFEAGRADLRKALDATSRTVARGGHIPALSCVLFTVTAAKVTATSTNLDTQVTVTVPSAEQVAGKMLIPHSLLGKVVAQAGELVELRVVGEKVKVTSGDYVAELPLLDANGLPTMTVGLDGKGTEVDAQAMATGFRLTAPFASRDEARPSMTAVVVDGTGDKVRYAATDSYRLSVHDSAAASFTGGATILVPAAAASTLAALIGDEAKATIHVGEPAGRGGKAMHVRVGTSTVLFRLVEGEAVNYQALLDRTETPTIVTVPSRTLASAVAAVSAVIDRGDPVVIGLKARLLELSGTATDAQAATPVKANVTKGKGAPAKVAFNSQYLAEALGVAGETVTIGLSEATKPALIATEGDESWTLLLMPIRVPELSTVAA